MWFILFAGVIHCQLSQGEGKGLPWWWCGGEDLIDDVVLSPAWWTFGEEGAEDSGVAISSMSEYSPDLEPFLLKALLKELRNCTEKKHETEQMMRLKTLN